MRRIIALFLFISFSCIAVPIEYNDVDVFKAATGGEPLYTIDFETFGNGNPVPPGDYSIVGDEWLNWGIQFAAIETADSLFLSTKADMPVSPTHALNILDPSEDRYSFLITFSTPVDSFGLYIIDNETRDLLVERIILKDEDGNVLGDYDMPGGAGPAPPLLIAHDFRGYSSTIPIAEVSIIENSDGEGILLDNVMFTPEPATILLLILGGLFLRKRKH